MVYWRKGGDAVYLAATIPERIGDLGKKIHTGRSRNDQVITDFKLYMRNKASEILDALLELQKTIYELAKMHIIV